jgi:hypothetical protein
MSQKQGLAKKTAARALISATVIGSLFFCWTVFVNWSHGSAQAFQAGAGQGTVSFLVSLSMAFILEYLYFLPGLKPGLRIPLAVSVTMLVITAVTASVHLLIGTPEILKTMALPVFMGLNYTTLYCIRLRRLGEQA